MTVAAIVEILEWEGPAILSGVRADLVAPTVGAVVLARSAPTTR
jgi:hypothetical protein